MVDVRECIVAWPMGTGCCRVEIPAIGSREIWTLGFEDLEEVVKYRGTIRPRLSVNEIRVAFGSLG